MGNPPVDARPDVEIRSTVYESGPGDAGEWVATTQVNHQAACRWCPESLSTPDVRTAVHWADTHEQSLGHFHTKAEQRAAGRGPRDPWASAWRDV